MSRLRTLWLHLIEGLWFVPGVIVLGSIGLAIGMVELSTLIDAEALARWPRIFGSSADGARSMLAAIAGSMITVAGVTFSITMVAVTQASSQYTPRILRNFMRDRANQIVLGIFVGIFAYCIVVLRTIRGAGDYTFVPSLAVLLGVLLAILGIAVLIFFVHHIATTLQASEIVARITHETVAAVEKLFPDEIGDDDPRREAETLLGRVPADGWRSVGAPATGYIQGIDGDGLLRVARQRGLIVRLDQEVGGFVVTGFSIAAIAPHPDAPGMADAREATAPADEAVAGRFTIANYRTIGQDVGFGLRQLVDIALKALSAGINDSTTAVTCVDHLGAILARRVTRRVEARYRSDDDTLRIVAPGPTFDGLVRLAFDEIRRNATGNVNVLARQLAALTLLLSATRQPARRELLLEQIALVEEAGERTVPSAHDRAELRVLANAARAQRGPP